MRERLICAFSIESVGGMGSRQSVKWGGRIGLENAIQPGVAWHRLQNHKALGWLCEFFRAISIQEGGKCPNACANAPAPGAAKVKAAARDVKNPTRFVPVSGV